jgi:hypothetical protein
MEWLGLISTEMCGFAVTNLTQGKECALCKSDEISNPLKTAKGYRCDDLLDQKLFF